MTNMLDGDGLLAFPNIFFYLSLIFWVGFFYVHYVYVFFFALYVTFFQKIPLIYLSPLIPLSFFYPHFIIEEAWLVQEDVGWIAIAIFLEA